MGLCSFLSLLLFFTTLCPLKSLTLSTKKWTCTYLYFIPAHCATNNNISMQMCLGNLRCSHTSETKSLKPSHILLKLSQLGRRWDTKPWSAMLPASSIPTNDCFTPRFHLAAQPYGYRPVEACHNLRLRHCDECKSQQAFRCFKQTSYRVVTLLYYKNYPFLFHLLYKLRHYSLNENTKHSLWKPLVWSLMG